MEVPDHSCAQPEKNAWRLSGIRLFQIQIQVQVQIQIQILGSR